MKTTLMLSAVSALAMASGLSASAQQYRPTPEYQRDLDEYQAARDRYEARRDAYEDRREDYRADRRDYEAAREAYERRLADWERARADYDYRYGYGAYARYHPRPIWDEQRWAYYDAPYAGSYGRNVTANVRCDNDSAVAGGVIGAIAGAVLGSQVAGNGARTEGSVLGGVVGAGLGAAVGHQNDKYRCDRDGVYFTYDETIPYREGRYRYSSRYDSDWYYRHGCRLAAAPVDSYGRDLRYVRVCPDDEGRFRITG
jgi:hypothetical protein